MRILVVDNSEYLAQRLCAVLSDLGQEPVLANDAANAIELIRQSEFDGVLVDLDMPEMNGVEFAETLWLYERYLPIGLRCSSADPALTAMATDIGELFPVMWTVADIAAIIARWRESITLKPQAVPRIAEGSDVALPPIPTLAASEKSEPIAVPADVSWLVMPTNKLMHRLSITCRRWDHVVKLCTRYDEGRNHLVVRGLPQLTIGEQLIVGFDLPNGTQLSIDAKVRAIRMEEGSRRACVIDLVGLTDKICASLRESVRCARTLPEIPMPRSSSAETLPLDAPPTASTPEAMVTSSSVHSRASMGWPLRSQIDRLANRLGHRVNASIPGGESPTPSSPLPSLDKHSKTRA